MTDSSVKLANAYQQACLAEIEALKPGNVHIFADGHNMVVQDFINSASASAPHIANPSYTLGERIFYSVNATWDAVACNTNLGIILLCAPIIEAMLMSNYQPLQQNLQQVLAKSTVEDAQWTFDAIKLAKPAGLGGAEAQDVNEKASETLLTVMGLAADKDLIARQYQQGYQLLFEQAIPFYKQLLERWASPAWATSALYLFLLAQAPDSHIQRKYSKEVAQGVSNEASKHLNVFLELDNPKLYMSTLLAFDNKLKEEGYNPGTSADLTVATILLYDCICSN